MQLSEYEKRKLAHDLSVTLDIGHDPGMQMEPLLRVVDAWVDSGRISQGEFIRLETSICQWSPES